jgi:hypothetical protein
VHGSCAVLYGGGWTWYLFVLARDDDVAGDALWHGRHHALHAAFGLTKQISNLPEDL